MKLLFEHFPASLVIGLAGWGLSGDMWCLGAALAAGWLIDVDHLVDFTYYLRQAGKSADYGLVKNGKYFKLNEKVFVPLHAWEITCVLSVSGLFTSSLLLLCAAMAHAFHLMQDQRAYRVRTYGYWLISRWSHGFEHEGFCIGPKIGGV